MADADCRRPAAYGATLAPVPCRRKSTPPQPSAPAARTRQPHLLQIQEGSPPGSASPSRGLRVRPHDWRTRCSDSGNTYTAQIAEGTASPYTSRPDTLACGSYTLRYLRAATAEIPGSPGSSAAPPASAAESARPVDRRSKMYAAR